LDRRAGREENGLIEIADSIKDMFIEGFKIEFHKSVAHRGVLTISNYNISTNLTDTDTGRIGDVVEPIRATKDDSKSEKTAAVLNKWLHEVTKILENHPANKTRKFPANYILLRGPGSYVIEKSFKEKYGMKGAVVAKSPVVRGIGKHFEMDVIDVSGATADLKTDLNAKTMEALRALDNHNFVVLHILGPDIAGHTKDIQLKKGFIEKIDRDVFAKIKEYVNFEDITLVVTSDHITSIFTGDHESGMFPFMIYTNGIESNNVNAYYENECKKGPVLDIQYFMEQTIKYL
ncbi:MAG: hypothetical protein KKI14_01295, partial [Nanoarchaeota archaeon]|nr:hypothetical protein [Nanoarchaeota archaeon]